MGLHEVVMKRAESLKAGKQGLGKYVWTVAALLVVNMREDPLKKIAKQLRDHFEDGGSMLDSLPLASSALTRGLLRDSQEVLEMAKRTAGEQAPTPRSNQSGVG